MSKHIPKPFIQELIERCDLISLMQTRLTLKKQGSNYIALCPFHTEKTPSFTVSTKKQLYHCFGCGASGNTLTFLMEYERLDFVEAVKLLAQQLGLQIPYESVKNNTENQDNQDLYQLLEKIARFYQQQLRQTPVAIDYLKQRGLTGKICKQFSVGYAPQTWDGLLKKFPKELEALLKTGMLIKKERGGYYDRFRHRIMFPIYNRQGKVIGFGGRSIDNTEPKYLNSPETAIFHKSNEWYGLYETQRLKQNNNPIIIVEGYFDVIALFQYGFTHAVAPLGTSITTEQLKRLTRYSKNLFFCFDGDTAGQQAAKRTLEILIPLFNSEFNIRFCLLPEQEDPDSFLRHQKPEDFSNLINKAITFSDFLLQHAIKINPNFDNKAHYVNSLLALIRQIPDRIYQQILLKQLADYTRIDPEKLQALLIKPSKSTHSTDSKKTFNKRPSPLKILAILLIQYPELHQEIAEFEIPMPVWMLEILSFIAQHPVANTASLLEHFRNHTEYQLIERLAHYPLSIPIEGITAEFKGVLKLIKKTQLDEQIELLLNKLRQTQLSDAAKQDLQQRLNAKIREKYRLEFV